MSESDSGQTTEAKIDEGALASKLRASFTPDEVKYLLTASNENRQKLLGSYEKSSPSEEKPKTPETESKPLGTKELIKDHLLAVRYHVFQWIDITVARHSTSEGFRPPRFINAYTDGRDTRGKPPFIWAIERSEKYEEIINYCDWKKWNDRPPFHTSGKEGSRLGMATVIKVKIKDGFGVLIHGAFSTEIGGRANTDNQIMFGFDSEEAASNFYDNFDRTSYHRNPEGVEKNIKIIKDSMSSVGIVDRDYKKLESHLFLGLEVKKF